MSKEVNPRGDLRVSMAVLDKIALTATREVTGVHDIEGLVVGAIVGSIAGGTLGFFEGGPVGAALGASVGTAAGVAVGKFIEKQHQHLYSTTQDNPHLKVRISAEYGANLREVADEVRKCVQASVLEYAGVNVGFIEVEIVEVVMPFHKRLE